MAHAACLMLLLSTALAVRDARAHLAEHKLDEVLFDLSGKHLEGQDAKEAAAVLGDAATAARADSLLALQFAQMALKLDPVQPAALEACARAAFAQKQFDLAEPCADRWLRASHKSGRARLLRAQIALDEGAWSLAASLAPEAREVPPEERAAAAQVRAQAKLELTMQAKGLSATQGLESALQAAMARAGREPSQRRPAAPSAAAGEVVVYGTSWCGYCKKARDYFRARAIPFEDKDVERDPDAVQELARKAEAAHLKPQGVPILDVHGTLISGFDVPRIEEALR